MKKIIALFVASIIAAGSAQAMCGKKVTDSGTLKSYNKDSKSIVVQLAGSTAEITLTPSTETKDATGKVAKLEDLIGKSVTVVSEHKKADSVQEAKKS
jgi:hypothetical protein